MGRRLTQTVAPRFNQQRKALLTAPSGTFTVPAGVFRLKVYTIGKGADGKPGNTRGGDGGAGGGCAWGEIPVTPGQEIEYSIDALKSRFGDYLEATAGVGRDAPGVGTVLSAAVEYSGIARGGYGGQGRVSTNSNTPSPGGGGAASGSPLGDGGDGAHGSIKAAGGGGWGGCRGSSEGWGAGVGGDAGYYSPSSSAVPGRSVSGNAYLPGRDQFTAFTDPLLAPCTGGLYLRSTGADAPAPGVGGVLGAPGGYGSGSGGNASALSAYLGGFGGGGGGGLGATTPAGCFDGSSGGYGGGGGGGGGTHSTASPATTLAGPGGPGCIAIFWEPEGSRT